MRSGGDHELGIPRPAGGEAADKLGRTRRLWSLRLDAEEELARRRAGELKPEAPLPRGTPGPRVAGAISALGCVTGPSSPYGLLAPGDRVAGLGPPAAAGGKRVRGAAWCLTPWALAELSAYGAAAPPAPDVHVLIRANARETFADLDALPGSAVCGALIEVERVLRGPSLARANPTHRGSEVHRGPAWLLRASLCAAGGARRIASSLDQASSTFAARQLERGPLHVTPVVDIVAEYALHGWLHRSGKVERGRPVQTTQAGGAWRGAKPVELTENLESPLVEAFHLVAARLGSMGYFGPFGIDAFEWEDASGQVRLHAPSEVNARYTMAFAVGAGHLIEGAQ